MLRWTKKMPVGNGKWVKYNDTNIFIESENDFNMLTFDLEDSSDTWYYFLTPLITMQEEFLNKDFCFSCYIRVEDWSKFTGTLSFSVFGHFNSSSTYRNAYHSYQLTKDKLHSNITLIPNDTTNNTWIKLELKFNLTEDFFTNRGADNSESDSVVKNPLTYDSIGIGFFMQKTGKIQIKKPKLELGKVATDWSASPYDVDYSGIDGVNLITDAALKYTISASDSGGKGYKVIATGLSSKTNYTLSWKNISRTKDTLKGSYKIFREGSTKDVLSGSFKYNTENFEKTLYWQRENDYSGSYELRLYCYDSTATNSSVPSGEKFTFTELKFEQGDHATGFTMSPVQVNDLINSLITNSTLLTTVEENGVNLYKITLPNGSQVTFPTPEDLASYIESIANSATTDIRDGMATFNGYNLATVRSELNVIQNSIRIDATAATPNITISAKSYSDDLQLVL